MNYPGVDDYLLAKPGVSKDFKTEWGWFRYLLGDKMFAAVCLDEAGKPSLITLKLEPAAGDFLRRQYPDDVIPGYYMNKIHWNSVRACGKLPEQEMRQALDESYRLVLAGLTKKSRAALLGGE